MKTRAECIEAAAEVLAESYRLMETLPAREVAERAYTPGGPTVDELEQRVREWRHEDIVHGNAVDTTEENPMVAPTPNYVQRPSDKLVDRKYLGSIAVPGVRDDVTDEELVSLHVDAAVSTAGVEVFAGQYSMSPDVARQLATALVQVADHLTPGGA